MNQISPNPFESIQTQLDISMSQRWRNINSIKNQPTNQQTNKTRRLTNKSAAVNLVYIRNRWFSYHQRFDGRRIYLEPSEYRRCNATNR